ncbi:MAG: SRPBCC family protein, partial [Chloroflexota bacterium]|nr:SRPBCC family protein [Chloroflexota bacterium]
ASRWQSGVRRAEVVSEGAMGVGTVVRYVVEFMGREIEIESAITEYEPNRRWSYRGEVGPIPFEGIAVFQESEGGTRVTSIVEATTSGSYKMAEPFALPLIRNQLEANAQRLKEILEGEWKDEG